MLINTVFILLPSAKNYAYKKYLKLAIRIIGTSVLLGLVFWRVDLQKFWQAILSAKREYFVLAWVVSTAFFVVRSYRLRLILKQQSLDVGTFTIFKVSAATALYSLILPGVMSTGVKWYILKKATGKGTNIFNSMVYNQLSEIIVMSCCALVVLIVTNPTSLLFPETTNYWLLPAVCSVGLVLLVASTLFLLIPRTSGYVLRALDYMVKPLPEKVRNKARQTLREATMFHDAGWLFHANMVLLNIVTQVVGTVVVYILAAKAANFSVPLTVHVWLASLVFILGRIPISIAGLGVREITLVGILTAYGVEESSALLMSMVLFSCIILRAIIGAGFMIKWSLAKKAEI
ncbi:MAG: lysylphosphatidylglycerol synthase transmembrane domain-containing protein [Planctomycetota bacterium]